MKVWVVVRVSCPDCNTIWVSCYSQKPSDEAVNKWYGACVNSMLFEMQVDGDEQETKQDD